MKLIPLATTITVFTATFAFAGGSGDHSHEAGHKETDHKTVQSAAEHGHTEGHSHETDHAMAVGTPGAAENVDRTIDITMRETDDGDMVFEPNEVEIKQGETIRFNITNKGELEHEFVLDTPEDNQKHKAVMAEMPDMVHDDPNAVRLQPGESGEIIWDFTNAGIFEFACLIPGHYESGMHGPVTVSATN